MDRAEYQSGTSGKKAKSKTKNTYSFVHKLYGSRNILITITVFHKHTVFCSEKCYCFLFAFHKRSLFLFLCFDNIIFATFPLLITSQFVLSPASFCGCRFAICLSALLCARQGGLALRIRARIDQTQQPATQISSTDIQQQCLQSFFSAVASVLFGRVPFHEFIKPSFMIHETG